MSTNKKVIVTALTIALTFCVYGISKAATANDTVQISVDVTSSISISSPSDTDIGDIAGTGSASADVTWNIDTNNSAGYKLEWQASAATMVSGGDTIAAYTPAVADTPEAWSVAASDSEWGARLKSTSTTYEADEQADWGTDDAGNAKWLNVNNAAVRLVSDRTSETSGAGDDQTVTFKAEVGSSKFQPTGSYTVNVTATATTL